jgi:hypothetical protein
MCESVSKTWIEIEIIQYMGIWRSDLTVSSARPNPSAWLSIKSDAQHEVYFATLYRRMSLPGENLSFIVKFALQDPPELHECNTIGSKTSIHGTRLSLLSGFSLASHKFRQIALREIFRSYHVTLPCHLHDLDRFPDVYRWARWAWIIILTGTCIMTWTTSVLHCPVNIAMQATKQHYAKFDFLRSVSLRGSAFGLLSILQRLPTSVQGISVWLLSDDLSTLNSPILELSLPFDHANDHTRMLTAISHFHNLRFLRVMSSQFEVPPVPLKDCGDVPPHHYDYSVRMPRIMAINTLTIPS